MIVQHNFRFMKIYDIKCSYNNYLRSKRLICAEILRV